MRRPRRNSPSRRRIQKRKKQSRRSIQHKKRRLSRANKRPSRPPLSDPKLNKALRFLRAGNSQGLAARSAGVSVRRFRRFIRQGKLASYRGRHWRFSDRRRRQVVAITTRGEKQFFVRGFEAASWAMSHRNAVKQFLATNDLSLLTPFEGKSLSDTRGRKHSLETRPNKLYRLAHAGSEPYEMIYRLLD